MSGFQFPKLCGQWRREKGLYKDTPCTGVSRAPVRGLLQLSSLRRHVGWQPGAGGEMKTWGQRVPTPKQRNWRNSTMVLTQCMGGGGGVKADSRCLSLWEEKKRFNYVDKRSRRC